MNPAIHDLMAFQGEIKVMLIKAGLSHAMADDLAAEVLHIAASGSIASAECRDAYAALRPTVSPLTPE